jgi:hypothetical protein
MIIILNNKEIELSDWQGAGTDDYEWNFWRKCVQFSNSIGFIVNSADSFKQNPNLATWRVTCIYTDSLLYSIAFEYDKIYNKPIFGYSELDKAKKDLDNFMLKFDRLKLYL